jgi:acetyl-CoA C-acetyltransferase
MVPLSARDRLDEAEGIRLAVDAALGATGIEPDSLDVVDLYSCYPAALRAHSDAVGVRDGLPLTVTGGMRFGGGPFNNYVLHATGQAALRLRSGQARYGAISSVSGMLTKHAFGVWGATPNPAGYQVHDVTDQVARHCRPRALRRDFSGKATIAGYTVLYEHNVPATAVAVLEPTDGSRVIARSADATAVGELSGTVEQCGRTVRVDGDQFTMQESAHGT